LHYFIHVFHATSSDLIALKTYRRK